MNFYGGTDHYWWGKEVSLLITLNGGRQGLVHAHLMQAY